MPQRIQRSRAKGWRMPEGAIYVGRPTRWGNPWRIGSNMFDQTNNQWRKVLTRADAVQAFRQSCDYDPNAVWHHRIDEEGNSLTAWGGYDDDIHINRRSIKRFLAGHDLVCWCPLVDRDGNHVPCHADVLLEFANG